jgi:hypothetical protein
MAEKHVRRDIAGNDRAGLNDRSGADTDARKDNAMRADKNVGIDGDRACSIFGPGFPPVYVGEDGGSESYGYIIPNRDGFRVNFVDIDILADPDSLADPNTSPFVEHGP